MAFVQSRHMDSWQLAKQSMHPHRITSGRFAHPNSALCLRQQQQQQQSSECTWQSQQESSTRVNPSKCQGCLCFRQTIHFTHRGDLLLLTRMHAWKAACCKRTRLKTHGLGWVAANVCHCTGLYMHTPLLCVQHVSWLCVCVCVCVRPCAHMRVHIRGACPTAHLSYSCCKASTSWLCTFSTVASKSGWLRGMRFTGMGLPLTMYTCSGGCGHQGIQSSRQHHEGYQAC